MEKISLSYAGRQISVAGWFVRAPNAQKGDSVSNNAKKVLFCLAAVFFIAFGVVTYRGYDKMTKYYNSGISSLNKNAYVEGDAYNYIINGTYATAYFVLGSGFLLTSAGMHDRLLITAIDGKMKKLRLKAEGSRGRTASAANMEGNMRLWEDIRR